MKLSNKQLLILFIFYSTCFMTSCNFKTNNDDNKKIKLVEGEDWIINTETFTIGKINIHTSEQELINTYGEENVKSDTIYNDAGSFSIGTLLYPGTKNEVSIEWVDRDNKKEPETIKINIQGSQWHTKEGIKIGTTLEELTKLNGTSFSVESYASEVEGGEVTDWNKGKFSQKEYIYNGLTVKLIPSKPVEIKQGAETDNFDDEDVDLENYSESADENEVNSNTLKPYDCKVGEFIIKF